MASGKRFLRASASVTARARLPLLALTALICVLYTSMAYARDVKVFFNNKEIVYDVPAQIIDGRTMVPLSQTFEAIVGQGTIYDSATRTSTYKANGHTNSHTIGTNVVYVDGIAIVYDTSSVIIDGRALVPIRMVTDTSGFKVDWDDINSRVLISSPQVTPTSAPVVPPSTAIQFYSFEAPKTTVNMNESIVLTAKTNSAATNVWFSDGSQNYNMTFATQDSNGTKTWVFSYTATRSVAIQAYANTTQSTAGAAQKAISLNVNSIPSQISSATASKTTVRANESIVVTVKTNNSANSVWVECNNYSVDAKLVSKDAYGTKTWTATISPSVTQQVKVYANSTKNQTGAASQNISITVGENATISSVTPNKTSIVTGESVTLSIRTNTAAAYVWVECNGNTYQASNTFSDYSSKTWSCSVSPNSSQQLRVIASSTNSTSGAATYPINVSVNTAVSVVSASASPSILSYGDMTQITVETNPAAFYVWVQTDIGQLDCTFSYTTPNGNKIWTTAYRAGNGGTFYAYAGRNYGSSESNRSFNVTVQSVPSNVKIISHNIWPGYINMELQNTRNTINITTNAAAQRVQISTSPTNLIQEATLATSFGDTKTWTVTMDIGVGPYWFGTDHETITITAIGQNGTSDKVVDYIPFIYPVG